MRIHAWALAAWLLTGCQPSVPVSQAALATGNFDSQINALRAAGGQGTLTSNPILQTAAQQHADDMNRRSYFAHASANGGRADSRIAAAGYRQCGWAENIADGPVSEAAVFQGWQQSTGHRRNMTRARYTEYGLASSGGKWVLVLARPC